MPGGEGIITVEISLSLSLSLSDCLLPLFLEQKLFTIV